MKNNRLEAIRLKQQREQQAELRDVSVVDWVTGNCMIQDPHRVDADAWIPFELWDIQRDYMDKLTRFKQIICLKARQLGFSWCNIAVALYITVRNPGTTILIVSKDGKAMKEVIRRARGMFQRLKTCSVRQKGRDNSERIDFDNGSAIIGFAASANAGTSFTGTMVMIDEADKIENGDSIYTSLRPTIADGGRLSVIFTVDGGDGLGRKLWNLSHDTPGAPGILQFFAPWWSRPGRTAEWYEIERRSALNEAFHIQEYPATPDEALNFTNVDTKLIESMEAFDLLYAASEGTMAGPMVYALDAAVADDSFALVGVGWHAQTKYPFLRFAKAWYPPVDEKGRKGKIDLPAVEEECLALFNRGRIAKIVYDPSQLASFGQKLATKWDAQEFSQNARRAEADTGLLRRIKNGEIRHAGIPVLRSQLDNADYKLEREKRIRIIKRRQELKIDVAVAASMAVSELVDNHPFRLSDYQATAGNKVLTNVDPFGINEGETRTNQGVFAGMPRRIYTER